MNIYEVKPEGAVLDTLTELSAAWESENITYGYVKSGREYIAKNRVFVAEDAAKSDGAQCITLSTATKDWKRVLHFYLDELGMEFWTAQLFKRL